ncbi:hypothetical protein DB88DRAFT_528729 [Papiliotrema laurentii]|uniref:STEEP1 domain-containing protein n=1 Tax=Papiliotrema laurentii TaxID=5418 RepID=A0AAD9D2C1_PAPLA|nr:hypothetical protein DB88DRAFT_528729 [Papiliotrema laurentii]
MPKVVSRFVVSSSEQSTATKSSRAVLRSYYCLCGDFVLVIQGKLHRLPRRRSDGSYIVRSKDAPKAPARKFKLNAQAGDRYLLQRKDSDKMEIRQPFVCGRCNLTVAYQTTPPPAGSGPFLYILKGSMTELQGRSPDDAFEGEEAVFEEDDLANELFDPIDPENIPEHMRSARVETQNDLAPPPPVQAESGQPDVPDLPHPSAGQPIGKDDTPEKVPQPSQAGNTETPDASA